MILAPRTTIHPNPQPNQHTKMSNTITIPHPGHPEHIENLASIRLLEAQGFEGTDASLEESLFEYGLIWRHIPETKEFLFVYPHHAIDGRTFDRCTFDEDTDVEKEFDYLLPLGEPDWDELTLPEKIAALIYWHGHENVFGASYWEGFPIADNQ